MKTSYKFVFALLACFVCGCPRTSSVVGGTDLGSSTVSASTDASVEASVDQ